MAPTEHFELKNNLAVPDPEDTVYLRIPPRFEAQIISADNDDGATVQTETYTMGVY